MIVNPQRNKLLLFDMEKDPEELRDRSDDPAYQRVKSDLMALFLKRQSKLNDPLGKIDFSVYENCGNLVSKNIRN